MADCPPDASAKVANDGSNLATGSCGSCGAFGCGCPCARGYTQLAAPYVNRTFANQLIPTVDCLRDIFTSMGLRPYTVRIVRTAWSAGIRGTGAEVVTAMLPILPTPLVSDLSALQEVLQPVGLDEVGSLQVSEISGRFTEDMLLGFDENGNAPDPNEQVYWEVEFLRPCSPGQLRRFRIRAAPQYTADEFQWRVTLERSHEDRARNGDPR